MAELFVRRAADAGRDHTSPAGLVIARLATFLAPQNAETWLVTAGLLADDDKPLAALDALAGISPTDPFAAPATGFRNPMLQRPNSQAAPLFLAPEAAAVAGGGVPDCCTPRHVLHMTEPPANDEHAHTRAVHPKPT